MSKTVDDGGAAMSDDIVVRLREVEMRERILGFGGSETVLLLSKESADTIEALRGENARLKGALEALVKDAQRNLFFMGSKQQMHPDGLRLCEFDYERARKALAGETTSQAAGGEG